MNNINPSHYFDRIEQYLHTANGIKPLQALVEFAKKDGAPEEMVDSVVNGALLDFIFDIMPAPNDFVHVYGPDGKANYIKKIEMTLEDWADSLVNTIQEITRERVVSILEYMYSNGILQRNNSNNCLYRGTAPIRRNLLHLYNNKNSTGTLKS